MASRFRRLLLVVIALHVLAMGVAFLFLLGLTSGGGEGYRVSPGIDASAAVLFFLRRPAVWLIEMGACALFAAVRRDGRTEKIRPNSYFLN